MAKQRTSLHEPTIEQLKQRYQELQKKKIQAETQQQNARNRLEELKEEAHKRYGTDDIEELKEKLHNMKQDNKRKCKEYKEHLDEIETNLAAVEEQSQKEIGNREATNEVKDGLE